MKAAMPFAVNRRIASTSLYPLDTITRASGRIVRIRRKASAPPMTGMVMSSNTAATCGSILRNASTPAFAVVRGNHRVAVAPRASMRRWCGPPPRRRSPAPARCRAIPPAMSLTGLSARPSTAGSRILKVEPFPGSLYTRMVPLCDRTIPRTADSPSPRPVNLVVKKGSKILALTPSSMPQPLSCTSSVT